jgi:hypothetical protein
MVSRAEKSTPLTKEHLVGEGMLMIVAGTDTTAASLSLTLHSLLQQPEMYRKLQDEIRTVMPSLDSRPTIQSLDTLPLLDACLKEGLRIASPVQCRLPREVPADGWTYKGRYFPPGASHVLPVDLFHVHAFNLTANRLTFLHPPGISTTTRTSSPIRHATTHTGGWSRVNRRRRCSPTSSPSQKAGGNVSDKSKPRAAPPLTFPPMEPF